MSDTKKDVILKALLDAKITELHPESNGEQIYLNGDIKLTAKLAEMIAAINARDKIVDVNAKIKGAKDYTDEEIAKISGGTTGDGTNVLLEAKMYTDNKIAGLINGAPSTLDTLKEITDAMSESEDIIHLLSESVGTKVDQSDYNATVSSLGLAVNGKVSKTEYDIDIANINSTLETKADTDDIPTKTSQLVNDSGFKTTDNNTTYALSKSGSVIKLTGSDGSETTVVDVDTRYSHPIFNDIAGTYRKVTIDNEGHVTFGSNAPVTIAEGGTGATTAEAALAALGAAPSEHTHKYAGSATAGGPAAKLKLTRDAETTADANYMPSTLGSTEVREYSNAAANLPSAHWYDVIANQSPDSKYGTQLAIGLTTDQMHYRRYDNGTFSDWKQLLDSSNYTSFIGNNTGGTDISSDEIIAENLINYPYCQTSRTASGMTFTVNEDGTIHAKGKPTAATNQGIRTRTTGDKNPMILPPGTYTIHGCPKGGSLTSYYFQVGCTRNDTFFSLGNDYGEGTTFTLTEETQIQILIIIAAECPEIDLVFKPMCEVGTVIHEYQPYVLSRHYLVDNTCVHNLIPYPYYNTSSNIEGIDWVDNGDGTVTASGAENSTSTISTFWLASVYNPIFLEAGTYTFTGCPEGASAETWYVRFGDENNNFLASDIGEGCYFTLQTDQHVTVSLRVADNVAIPDKIVFKPMLVKGSVPREYKQYKDVEDQIVADNLIESNIDTTGFVRCTTKAYNNGTCILTADGTSGNPYHYRDYVLEQGKTYTFSTKGNSADAKGWYMAAMYIFDTSPVTYETLKTVQIYTNNYKTQSMTFTVNKECRAVRIVVGIPNGAATAGTKATFTEMMLEEGAVAHKYQLPRANKGYNRVDITNHTLDLNTLNLELGSPDIMQYKCRTSGGSANITNIPVTSSPFNLDVEVVRWASKTDYVTRQVFVVVNKPNFEYVRWCTSGTWSEWVERKFTDTTYSNMTAATADAAGKAGLVPAPAKGNQAKFLRGDGTWQTPTNTTYSVATTSADGLMSKTDKTKLDNTNVAYGTCSTAAATAAKVITVSGNTNWTLKPGATITVKFTNTNTAQNPTFNVNNTGAKKVWYNTEVITKSNLGYAGYANRIMNFIYDGTQYVFIGWSVDSNSDTKNTTGTTNKVDTKLFLAGATSQGANPQTYSNANVYIGTDNCLYSNGKKVVHEVTITTDTDFDTFTETGIYHIAFTGGSNRPCANHGTLYVDTEVGTDYQLFIPDSVHTVTYKRSYDNTNKVWKAWTTQKLTDTNTTYSNMTAATSSAAGKAGLVPAPEKGAQAKFLRGDGTWQTPTNTTYSNFVKSGSGAKAGLVPAPSTTAGTTKYLREDGTWQVPPDTNTTYTNASLGQGYTTCSTAEATLAKTATITGYNLVNFGIVSVKFTYKVLANSTLNITSKGAKPIYYRGAAITDGIINAGDIATFMYNGSQYHLISIDKGILNNTTKGSLGYNSSTAQNLVPTVSTIAYWDGAYANTSSNLAYCRLGAFGDAAVKGVDTTPTSGSVNLVTSGGVYDELNKPDYGTCSTAAATVEKAVTCTGWELKTGAEITIKFTVTNTANNPTLNVNSTGAKPIYYRGSAITAGYLAANRTYTFRFNGTQYEFVGDLDSNSFDRIRYNGNIKCSATAIVTGNIIVGSNGTFQHLKLGKPFDITYPILYAGAAIAANGTGSNNYKCIAMTITTTQSITLTAYKPVYIKGKLVGTTFTPVSTTPLTQTVPTTADGYQYILLGLSYTSNGVYMYPENPIYEYANGKFGLYGGSSSGGTTLHISDTKPTISGLWFNTSGS